MSLKLNKVWWGLAGALLSVLAGVSLIGGEEPPKPDFGRTGELFTQAVRAEGREYAQARDALEGLGKGVLSYLTNQTTLGKSWEERLLAQILLMRFNRKEEFEILQAEFHRKVVASTGRPPVAPRAWAFNPMAVQGLLFPEEVDALLKDPRIRRMWDQHPREKEIWREYRARLTLEKTDELPLFLLEVLLKGWWGPVPGDWEAPGWGDVHRYQAVILLGKLKEKRAYEPLLALFQDEKQNEFLRAHAARGLGLLGDPRALPPLREAFLAGAKQVPPEVWQSERARVGLLVYDLINNLIRGIAPNWIVAEAGLALKQMRGPEAVTAWGEWLKSEDPQRRLLAVDFLREIGDASALPALKEAAANDQNTQVREAAEAAVRQMEER